MESLPVQDQIRAEKKQMQASLLGAKEAVHVEGLLDVQLPPMSNASGTSQIFVHGEKYQEMSGVTANLNLARSMLEATLRGKTARELLIRDPDHQRVRDHWKLMF
jgi:hypothetical protein